VIEAAGEDEEQVGVEEKWDKPIVPVRTPPICPTVGQEEFNHCLETDKVGGAVPR
jgi:hypothetical protein